MMFFSAIADAGPQFFPTVYDVYEPLRHKCYDAMWAKNNGYKFVLEVRAGAHLSGPLQEAIDSGDIILRTIGQTNGG